MTKSDIVRKPIRERAEQPDDDTEEVWLRPPQFIKAFNDSFTMAQLRRWRSCGEGPPYARLNQKTVIYGLKAGRRYFRERIVQPRK